MFTTLGDSPSRRSFGCGGGDIFGAHRTPLVPLVYRRSPAHRQFQQHYSTHLAPEPSGVGQISDYQ